MRVRPTLDWDLVILVLVLVLSLCYFGQGIVCLIEGRDDASFMGSFLGFVFLGCAIAFYRLNQKLEQLPPPPRNYRLGDQE